MGGDIPPHHLQPQSFFCALDFCTANSVRASRIEADDGSDQVAETISLFGDASGS
jgi:hypothetical protein